MARLHDLISDPDVLLAMPPEELAGVIMEHLHSLPKKQLSQLNRSNYTLRSNVDEFAEERRLELCFALMEGWMWLESEGLVAPRPESSSTQSFITRRGQQLRDRGAVEQYRRANILPTHALHPRLAQATVSPFLRGDYEICVFQTFRLVEVMVREAAELSPSEIGVPLMRAAFHHETGPLRDGDAIQAERMAKSHLFAGAIGVYKNPASHREIQMEAEEAVELVMFGNALIRIIDRAAERHITSN